MDTDKYIDGVEAYLGFFLHPYFEGIATATIAASVFGENVGKRAWIALTCMNVAWVFLTWDPSQGKFVPLGPLLPVFAMACWDIGNNLTRNLFGKDAVRVAEIKGLIAGAVSLSFAYVFGKTYKCFIAVLRAIEIGQAQNNNRWEKLE